GASLGSADGSHLPAASTSACATLPASEDVTAITNYSSNSPLFFGRRVIDVQSPKRRPPTTALSKKLHSLPSSVRRIIQLRGWRALVATAAENRCEVELQTPKASAGRFV